MAHWIHERRTARLRVSSKLVCTKAKRLYFQMLTLSFIVEPDFTASRGWFQKFQAKHGFSIRRRTTVALKDSERLVDKLVAFVLEVRQLRSQGNYLNRNIIAMDETAAWKVMLSNTTVDKSEKKIIRLKTKHEKAKVTICLTAKADRSKLKPFSVFAGAKRECYKLHDEIKGRGSVASSSKDWMNDELTLHCLDEIVRQFSFGKSLLVWDCFRCHISDAVKAGHQNYQVDSTLIIGEFTDYIQAADVVEQTIQKGIYRVVR